MGRRRYDAIGKSDNCGQESQPKPKYAGKGYIQSIAKRLSDLSFSVGPVIQIICDVSDVTKATRLVGLNPQEGRKEGYITGEVPIRNDRPVSAQTCV